MKNFPPRTIAAYAKLNLALAVGPPQPPRGFHPIASWIVAIDLHDTLTLERLPEGEASRFEIRWAADAPKPTPIDWPVAKDLAARAHALLQERTKRVLPIALTLDKRIPVGGGLGGGSSDAASTLVGVNEMFDLGIARAELAILSAGLGSDIAFFIDDGSVARPALVLGLGDRIERLAPVPVAEVLLIIPPFGCPTGPVYGAFDRGPMADADEKRVRKIIAEARRSGGIPSGSLFNDLAAPACEVEPRLRETLGVLRAAVGPRTPIHVTGSGSTMFCLPDWPGTDRPGADRVEGVLRAARPELVVVRARTM